MGAWFRFYWDMWAAYKIGHIVGRVLAAIVLGIVFLPLWYLFRKSRTFRAVAIMPLRRLYTGIFSGFAKG